MFRRLIISAFVGLGLAVLTASAQQAQPPAKQKTETVPGFPGQPKKEGGDSAGKKKTDSADAQVQAALASDPDVKMAQAKIQLAEAELAKARQAVVLKVMTLNATIKELKSQVAACSQSAQVDEAAHQKGTIPLSEVLKSRMKLEQAQNALARGEMELKLLTSGTTKETTTQTTGAWTYFDGFTTTPGFQHPYLTSPSNYWQGLNQQHTLEYSVPLTSTVAKGPIPDRIRVALDKNVKLGQKGEQVTFTKALEVFKKDAGLDVPVRLLAKMQPIASEGEELPVGAWFQVFADSNLDVRFLVREYGLLVTVKEQSPPDAMQLVDFWKRPMKKEPEPKAKAPGEPEKK